MREKHVSCPQSHFTEHTKIFNKEKKKKKERKTLGNNKRCRQIHRKTDEPQEKKGKHRQTRGDPTGTESLTCDVARCFQLLFLKDAKRRPTVDSST